MWPALTRRRTSRGVKLESRLTKLKQQGVRAKQRRTNAGTVGMGAASHLAPWIWTWDEQERLQLSDLAADGRSELPHQIFFGTADSRMRQNDLGSAG